MSPISRSDACLRLVDQMQVSVDQMHGVPLNSNWISSTLVKDCTKELNKLSRHNKVTLQWIKAHVGHLGNEKADELAKKGALAKVSGPEPFLPISSTLVKTNLKRKFTSIWKVSF